MINELHKLGYRYIPIADKWIQVSAHNASVNVASSTIISEITRFGGSASDLEAVRMALTRVETNAARLPQK